MVHVAAGAVRTDEHRLAVRCSFEERGRLLAVDGDTPLQAAYSTFTRESLTRRSQRSYSVFRKAANSSGVLPTTSNHCFAERSLKAGSLRIFVTSRWIVRTTSDGMPAGPTS